MNILRIILVFFICFLLITITLQNLGRVERVKLFFDEFYNVPLASIILIAYLFGLLTVGIFALIGEIRVKSEIRKLKKEKEALLAELSDLRNYFLIEKGEEK
ncbi:MAG: LapA family protein [candidate division WOR-3 bacterium]|nr:LapA family protein [candidate division WOR-3 bacterium]MCX7836486.1 LapA family protein [candidate division WOR-3 bacterium]MDW8114535.1 LapA family protein [candidate division WOR-3 bacterium]